SGGLQVAVAMGTNGKIKRFELSREWMKGMDQVERLGSHIDEGLLEVAKEVMALKDDIPIPIQTAVSKWRPGLGAKYIDAQGLHDAVRVLNFKVPAAVLHWYKRYRHLSVWRDNLRSKLIGRRREIYRLAAREIAQSYRIIGIEDMDLSKMAKTKKSDFGDNELFAAARAQRVRAAVHSLREEIEHQAVKHGAQIVYSTAYTTCRCRVCGQITRQHDRSMLVWVCEHCGATWDQDFNAAGNLMAAASGASADVTGVVGDEKSTDNSLVLGQKKDLSKIGHQLSENVIV
ncbi:MAG: zinc ribbon domain-containing protein, partial [Desulfobacteraceae bacterium]|nr:zinc ribbon domain-containing protein [Desulfobacteraceae bacterium]